MGEWEWCLVLLEELEQQDAEQEEEEEDKDAGNAPGAEEAGDEDDETVLRVELDESGTPITPASAIAAATTAAAAAAAETSAAYTAAVRACGKGRAGAQAVVGILERMRWAGVEPGEDAYAAAISAYRACGGVWEAVPQQGSSGARGASGGKGKEEEEEEREATGKLSAAEAAEALLRYGRERDDPVWASPYLYR